MMMAMPTMMRMIMMVVLETRYMYMYRACTWMYVVWGDIIILDP